jgi:secreted protein with Ig-like and vWFA domain/tetratricopeptide (TPR) repeat protein
MNAPTEPTPAQQSAARLTAWATAALPASSQAAFEAELLADPALLTEAEATRDFCAVLGAELSSALPAAALELSAGARQQLEAAACQKPASRRLVLWVLALSSAACFALLLAGYKVTGERALAEQQATLLLELEKAEANQEAVNVPAPVAPQIAANDQSAEVRRFGNMGRGYYELGQYKEAEEQFNKVLAIDPTNADARRSLARVEREVNNYLRSARDHTRMKMLAEGDDLWVTPLRGHSGSAAVKAPAQVAPPIAANDQPADVWRFNNIGSRHFDYLSASNNRTPPRMLPVLSGALGDWQSHPEEFTDLNRPVYPLGLRPASDGSFKFSVQYDFGPSEDPAGTFAKFWIPNPFGPLLNSAGIAAETRFLPVKDQPLSTFSIDVDTASYAITRRHLNQGDRPPVESVRLEEMINYFPMDDAPPMDGKPFAVHVETASAPWQAEHRLVRVALKGRAMPAGERPAARLVFLVDTSGSMGQPNKLPLVQQSLQLLLSQLAPADRVALVTYAGESRVALPSTPVSERAVISAAIEALASGGGTNGSGGIAAAYELARASFLPSGVNRVILATDGDFNVGITDEKELKSLITREAKSGVYLSVLGYGSDNLKDTTAETLADAGNGNYAYIDSLSEARRALVTQLQGTLTTIAKDVKIQVEFNPARVSSYRLLGYENRALANQDFNNDAKDAGEIGAGHSVTALYEIVPAGQPMPDVATTKIDPLKYQTAIPEPPPPASLTPQAASGELLTIKLRYQLPEGTAPSQLLTLPVTDSGAGWEQASANFRWTAAVAGYGMLLRDSPPPAKLTWDTVRRLAAGAKGTDPEGFRGEFLQLIERATSVVPGQ